MQSKSSRMLRLFFPISSQVRSIPERIQTLKNILAKLTNNYSDFSRMYILNQSFDAYPIDLLRGIQMYRSELERVRLSALEIFLNERHGLSKKQKETFTRRNLATKKLIREIEEFLIEFDEYIEKTDHVGQSEEVIDVIDIVYNDTPYYHYKNGKYR